MQREINPCGSVFLENLTGLAALPMVEPLDKQPVYSKINNNTIIQ